jgi:hypothetical protein
VGLLDTDSLPEPVSLHIDVVSAAAGDLRPNRSPVWMAVYLLASSPTWLDVDSA